MYDNYACFLFVCADNVKYFGPSHVREHCK